MKMSQNTQMLNALIDDLSNEDPTKRAAAARQLGNLKDERAIHSLVTALGDSKWVVRKEAAYSILDICKGSERQKNLLKLLRSQIQEAHSSYERFNNYLDEDEYFERGIGIDIEEYYKNGIRK
jgi:HEAT repeat protein